MMPVRDRCLPRLAAGLMALLLFCGGPGWAADGHRVGEVSTTFRLLGRNDQIAVDRYDDPGIPGIACYLSHAETGGVAGTFGLATDPSRFSLSCVAGPAVALPTSLPENEVVFGQRTSLFFKELRVTRMVDRERQAVIYLAWSTKSVSPGGSPFNAVSVVPVPGH
jgi:CreA protein